MIYQMSTFKNMSGYNVICNDLVGKGHHGYWNYPAIILGISLEEFVRRLVCEWGASLMLFTDSRGHLEWISYHWKDESKANKFKNAINLLAKQKNILI